MTFGCQVWSLKTPSIDNKQILETNQPLPPSKSIQVSYFIKVDFFRIENKLIFFIDATPISNRLHEIRNGFRHEGKDWYVKISFKYKIISKPYYCIFISVHCQLWNTLQSILFATTRWTITHLTFRNVLETFQLTTISL